MNPSHPTTEPTPQVPALWARPKVITLLVVLLVAYWINANWTDLKAGARDGWADARSR